MADSPGDLPNFVVMNPTAIGNPDENPQVFIGDALAVALALEHGTDEWLEVA